MSYLLDVWNNLSENEREIILDKGLLALVIAIFTAVFSIIVARYKHFLLRRAALEATVIPRIYDLMKEADSIYAEAMKYFTEVVQVYNFYFKIADRPTVNFLKKFLRKTGFTNASTRLKSARR
jgi:hypothetical protein